MRWPKGFAYPKCGNRKYGDATAQQVFCCSIRPIQSLVKSGTIVHKSRAPLVKWFLANYLLMQSKNDVAALELARQPDVKWDAAWLIKQTLIEAMHQRNQSYKFKGNVQIDHAYLGGKRVHTRQQHVTGFTSENIKTYAAANIEAGAPTATDGLPCLAGVTGAGITRWPIITGSYRASARFGRASRNLN